jgi:hypothetical protein
MMIHNSTRRDIATGPHVGVLLMRDLVDGDGIGKGRRRPRVLEGLHCL